MTYAHYACVADFADAMADAWEDTAGCAQPICLHENLLRDSIPLCGDCTGSCTHERGLCSEYAHECGYSLCASLCNYSFLVRLHVSSKSPELYVVEVYADYPIRYDRTDILPACTRYQQSGYGQRSWFITVKAHTFGPRHLLQRLVGGGLHPLRILKQAPDVVTVQCL